MLDEEFYAEHTPKKIWVQYAKELQEGEKAKIQYVWEEDVMYLRGVHLSLIHIFLKLHGQNRVILIVF